MAAPGHKLGVRTGARLTRFPEPSPPGDQSQHHTGEAGGRAAMALALSPEPLGPSTLTIDKYGHEVPSRYGHCGGQNQHPELRGGRGAMRAEVSSS